jgi:hypothetical protein
MQGYETEQLQPKQGMLARCHAPATTTNASTAQHGRLRVKHVMALFTDMDIYTSIPTMIYRSGLLK